MHAHRASHDDAAGLDRGVERAANRAVKLASGTTLREMARFMMQSLGVPTPLSFDPRGKVEPVLTSDSTRWAGIPFEVHDAPSVDGQLLVDPMPGERGWMIALEGTRTMFVQRGRSQQQILSKPGFITFAEGGSAVAVSRIVGRSRVMVFRVPAIWHERLLLEGGPEHFTSLPPIPACETARALGHAMYAEVVDGAGTGAMFAESLSLALMHFVLERMPTRAMRVRGSLSDGQRRRLTRFIEEQLHNDITLTDLAQIVGLRPRHFSSLFRAAFGTTPHQYLIERRLEHGARLLSSSGADVAAIALHVGFSSQSHFATAFRKRYGVSPRRYAVSRRSSIAGS